MPVYEFLCTSCDEVFQVIGKWDEVGQEQNCKNCNSICKKIPSLTYNQSDQFWSGVYAPNVDKWFTSKSKYYQYLKENNKVIVEKGTKSLTPQEKAARNIAKNEKIRKEIVADVVRNNIPYTED